MREQFDDRVAARELRRYRRRGPPRSTRLLLGALRREGVAGASLLDIGGGVGAIQHELLASGVDSTLDVDISESYLAAARREGRRRSKEERMRFASGDFLDLAPSIEPADIVTLDRVICCYPEMELLVRASASRAKRLYGLVYPRSGLASRFAARLANHFLALWRSAFRLYVHPTGEVDRIMKEQGFVLAFHRKTVVWQIFVYRREGLA